MGGKENDPNRQEVTGDLLWGNPGVKLRAPSGKKKLARGKIEDRSGATFCRA